MFRKANILLALILSTKALFAQQIELTPFQNIIELHGAQKIINLIIKDSSLLLLGTSHHGVKPAIEILETSFEGEVQNTIVIENANYNINPFQMLQTSFGTTLVLAEHVFTNHNATALYLLDQDNKPNKTYLFGTDSTYQTMNFIQEVGNYFYLAGTYSSPSMSFGNDFWVMKITKNLEVVWDKHFGIDSINEVASSLQVVDDKIFVFGDKNKPNITYNPYYITLDTLGNFIKDTPLDWDYNGGVKMSCKTNEHIFVVGESSTPTSSWFDIYLDKLDFRGNRIWRKLLPGTAKSETGFDIKYKDNLLFITGYAHNDSLNNTDMHATIVDTSGNILSQKLYNYGAIDIGQNIVLTNFGGYYVVGFGKKDSLQNYFLVFDTTSLLKNTSSISENKKQTTDGFVIVPNPSAENVSIFVNSTIQYDKISVYTSNGKLLLEKPIYYSKQIPLELKEKGIYFVQLKNKNIVHTKKLIRY